ncbi:MAG: MBL fold metallo-hydrolase [Chloroflexota bacterium]|jgi:ribonuclease BN (tRNA processing enzyme)
MRLQVLGSGDAFGNGGRFQSCYLLDTGSTRCLIECGASSLISMKRYGVDPNSISLILVSHMHADHFGGLPFFLLDAQFSKRRSPLTVVGPEGIRERLPQLMELSFPGSSSTVQKYDLSILEWTAGQTMDLGLLSATPYEVCHGAVRTFALRLAIDGQIVSYSGDTEWCDGLAEAARGADLFLAEAYSYEKPIKGHLNVKSLEEQLPTLGVKRLVLTHSSPDMLSRIDTIGHEAAEDGKIIEL